MKLMFNALIRIFQYLVYCISFVHPRNNKVWVFGSFGVYSDNGRYFYEYMTRFHPEVRSIWISNNKKSVLMASRYGEAYYSLSIKGLYCCLISGVYVYTAYARDICWYCSGNAMKVNLWHGIPLKKIEFDITTKPLVDMFKNANLFSRFKHPHTHIQHDLVLSPSLYVANYSFISAFRLKDLSNVIISRYPRVNKLKELAGKRDELSEYNDFTFVYAPTWRDSGSDFIADSGIDFLELDKLLATLNAKLYVKLHPATKIDIDNLSLKRIIFPDNQDDICNLLAKSDCLITDYSSVYFDYLILDRPIIFFPFDKDVYLREREFYFDYDDYTPGCKATNFNDLINEMNNVCASIDLFKKERNRVLNLFDSKMDSDSNGFIFNSIVDKLN